MTKEELKQIYYLNKEVKMWQDELNRLECQSLVKGQEITGMPHQSGISDRTSDNAIEIADLRLIINGKLAEIQIQRKRIIEYINSIEDSLIRQIFFYRNVSCMSWNKVAQNIGGDNNSESVRQAYHRYLKSCHTCHNKK